VIQRTTVTRNTKKTKGTKYGKCVTKETKMISKVYLN
jgi:hypothetical protein